MSTLNECQEKIADACNYTLVSSKNATVQDCLTAATKFREEFKDCVEKSENVCSCMSNNIASSNYIKLIKCAVPNQISNDIKEQFLNKCVKGE